MEEQRGLSDAVLDGKYRLTHLLGQGGMGAVYGAEHLGTDRPVAVKVLLSELVRDTEATERFRREARAAGRLRHPNVVDVTDFGVAAMGDQEIAYLVMESLTGSSLRATLDARGRLPLDVVVEIVEQIAAALEAAHAEHIIHRDLKPDNVWLVPDGRGGFTVRVLDFGIARLGQDGDPLTTASAAAPVPRIGNNDVTLVRGSDDRADYEITTARLTTAGTLIGTPLYMSPEQCSGTDVDPRSDVYSLGVLAYEALTGKRPFSGSLPQVIEGHLKQMPPQMEGVPPRVGEVVMRALAKAPDARYATARAFSGSLRVAAEGPGVILRRSAALYIERLDEFLRISAALSKPPLFVGGALMLLAAITAAAAPDPRLALIPLAIAGILAPVLWGAVTMTTNAAFAAVIERLRTRPLERVTPAELATNLRERLALSPSAGYLRTAMRLIVYYARCEARSPAGSGDLAFLIGFLEGVALPEIPPRCSTLVAATRSAYNRVRAAIFAGLFALPLIEAALLGLFLSPFTDKNFAIAAIVAVGLVPLNAVLINPIFSSALALLYFRARQANGEDVPLAAVLPGRL